MYKYLIPGPLYFLYKCTIAPKVARKYLEIEIFPDVNPMVDVVERVNDIYSSVVASEECMERIACEVGGLAKDVGLTHPAVR